MPETMFSVVNILIVADCLLLSFCVSFLECSLKQRRRLNRVAMKIARTGLRLVILSKMGSIYPKMKVSVV